jgi:hypothetical protein
MVFIGLKINPVAAGDRFVTSACSGESLGGAGLLPKWNGARGSHPQQPGLPDEHTKFHGFLVRRTRCG